MLNQVLPQQIQPQVQQSGQGKNDNAHSGKSESEQFNTILSREISAKEPTSNADEMKKGTSDRNAAKSEQTSTVSDKANNDNTGDNARTGDSVDTKGTATASAPVSDNRADNSSVVNGMEAQQLPGIQVALTENNFGTEILLPIIPVENPAALKLQTGVNSKSAGITPGLGLATAASAHSMLAGFQQEGAANFMANNGGNNPWQALQAGYSGDRPGQLTFETGNGESLFPRIGEVDPSINTDFDMPQHIGQPGLNGVTHSANQSALQTSSHPLALDTQMGQPKWGNDFSQKIVWLAHQNHQVAELKLNPAHLGPVEIMLSLSGDNGTQAAAQFVSPHLAVREAIEAALPRLREMMAESGIQLGDVMVGSESFQQNDKGEQFGQQHARHSNQFGGQDESTGSVDQQIVSTRHNGIVNTFA